jgi:hypothetical protein
MVFNADQVPSVKFLRIDNAGKKSYRGVRGRLARWMVGVRGSEELGRSVGSVLVLPA